MSHLVFLQAIKDKVFLSIIYISTSAVQSLLECNTTSKSEKWRAKRSHKWRRIFFFLPSLQNLCEYKEQYYGFVMVSAFLLLGTNYQSLMTLCSAPRQVFSAKRVWKLPQQQQYTHCSHRFGRKHWSQGCTGWCVLMRDHGESAWGAQLHSESRPKQLLFLLVLRENCELHRLFCLMLYTSKGAQVTPTCCTGRAHRLQCRYHVQRNNCFGKHMTL